jgi:predicted HTH domain antitoxin
VSKVICKVETGKRGAFMAKAEVEVQFTFTLPIDESFLQHKTDAERKAKEAFVLELLRHGDISAGRAAKLLDISRWDLSDLMSEAGISPFAEVTAEELAAEVETALKVLNNQDDEDCHK